MNVRQWLADWKCVPSKLFTSRTCKCISILQKNDKRTSEPKHCKTNTQRLGLLKKPCATRCEIFHFARVLLQTTDFDYLGQDRLRLFRAGMQVCAPNYAIEYQSCIWCYIQLLPVVQNIFCVLEVPVNWLTTRDVVQVTIQTHFLRKVGVTTERTNRFPIFAIISWLRHETQIHFTQFHKL